MNKIRSILIAGFSSLICLSASAQGHEDLLRFSQYNYSFGTARFAAMGGAFSSLGADFSSTVINPAGLGMYRRSEISISPGLTFNRAKTTNLDEIGTFTSNSNKTKFALNNFGGVFNVYNGTGAVTSFSFGFGYSKLSDYNTQSSVVGRSYTTMIDYFGHRIAQSGITPADNSSIRFTGSNQPYWDAIMAYNTSLIDYNPDGNYYAPGEGLFDMQDAIFDSRLIRTTKGSTGQYDIAGGINFLNIVYVGFGFGIQDITYRETLNYYEAPEDQSYGLNNFRYIQTIKQDGTGWNFKFGMIFRPIDDLRIGLSIHTPTYIVMDEHYYADMYSTYNDFNNGVPVHSGVQYGTKNTYHMQTPTRFLAGLSYTVNAPSGPLGVISVDYERVWYNKMKLYWNNWDDEDFYTTQDVEAIYKAANNIRVGAEAILTPNVFLRLGYAFYASMYKHDYDQDYGKTSNYSAGLGYRTGIWSIDLAYIYMDNKDIPRQFFNSGMYESGIYRTNNQRNNINLTASIRF